MVPLSVVNAVSRNMVPGPCMLPLSNKTCRACAPIYDPLLCGGCLVDGGTGYIRYYGLYVQGIGNGPINPLHPCPKPNTIFYVLFWPFFDRFLTLAQATAHNGSSLL